ncbi:MAG: gliding motility-associated C-terminal domain-containing protein [Lewinellaceae bacterium]|nr:gliding motility-associated C-terminal domain-containing protein [Phaeodactylibacter sp.]MCB9038821.1 gliding motility-associated C-terminal domain-containing protein [Lewinellaceae bacterium]
MKQQITLFLFILTTFQGFAQNYENCPAIEWQACHGGSSIDGATVVIPTADGGYFAAGWSRSDDFDLTGNQGESDFLLLKLTADGTLQWARSYGGQGADFAWDALQTGDGGFLIAGMADEAGGDVTANLGQTDAWLIKVDENGNLLWEKTFGTPQQDAATQILPGPDDSYYLLTGSTSLFRFDDFPFYAGAEEEAFTVYHIQGNGNILTEYFFQASHLSLGVLSDGNLSLLADQPAGKAIQVRDENFNLLQEIALPPGPLPAITWIEALQLENGDWILLGRHLIDGPSGRKDEVVAQRITADSERLWFQSILANPSRNLWLEAAALLAGDKIILGLNPTPVTGSPEGDYWAAWLEPNGEISNLRQLGGSRNDQLTSLSPTSGGDLLLAGSSESQDGDVQDCYPGYDAWLVKLGALPGGALPEDTLLCPGEELAFEIPAAPNFTVQWQDGTTGNTYTAGESGTYFYEGRQGDCRVRDTSTVRLLEAESPLSLADTTLCQDATLLLDATVEGASLYLWQDGAKEPLYEVIKPGRYLVKAVVEECVLEDSVAISWCAPCLAIPNAFTPNGDGVNDFFAPILQCPFPNYNLEVFNRWGQLVFQTDAPQEGWDGTFNGQPAPSEVYFFQLSYQEFEGEPAERRQGDLGLLR